MNHIIDRALHNVIDDQLVLDHLTPVHGGSINKAYLADTSSGKFFVKMHKGDDADQNHEAEMRGLRLLQDYLPEGSTPYIRGQYLEDRVSVLVLDWVNRSPFERKFWEDLAQKLALIHRVSADRFGLDHNNYMGALPQVNTMEDDWLSFWANHRVLPLIRSCEKILGSRRMDRLEHLVVKASHLFPEELPALIHGDLWSGNVICCETNGAMLVDPAVSFGHREADIAMTRLFGRFSPIFYEAYNEIYPLEFGWEERTALNNLYPLLVHLKLFGETYLAEIDDVLKTYS